MARGCCNAGPDGAGTFTMDFVMTDPTIQHRTFITYNDAVNAVVAKGIQQQDNNAQYQAVPKFQAKAKRGNSLSHFKTIRNVSRHALPNFSSALRTRSPAFRSQQFENICNTDSTSEGK